MTFVKETVAGQSVSRRPSPGYQFELAEHPRTRLGRAVVAPQQLGDKALFEGLKGRGVAKEAGEVDGQGIEEGLVLGRVLAEEVFADADQPPFSKAMMDGFALRSKEIAGAMPTLPVVLQTGQQAVYVDTGDPLPVWADAVVPIEQVEAVDLDGNPVSELRNPPAIRLRAALPPWSHVRPMGEDIVATQLILPAGQVLRPVDLGAIAASGYAAVVVSRQPRVAILPTGTELVPVGQAVNPGDIIEYNSIVLAGQVQAWENRVWTERKDGKKITTKIWTSDDGTTTTRPDLAAGDGVLGVGFSIGGLSAITRCPSNLAQDGTWRKVEIKVKRPGVIGSMIPCE